MVRNIPNNDNMGAVMKQTETKEAEALKRLTIELTEQLHRNIKVFSSAQGCSMSAVIRNMLEKKEWSIEGRI